MTEYSILSLNISKTFQSLPKKKNKMQAKLAAIKDGLQEMMTRSHWRKEWKDEVTKWSEEVTVRSGSVVESVLFPMVSGRGILFIVCSCTTLEPMANYSMFAAETSCKYWNYSSAKYFKSTTINLFFDVFRYFVLAFGSQFTPNLIENGGHWQWLRADEENKRHYEIIKKSLIACGRCDDKKGVVDTDHWIMIWDEKVQLGGKVVSAVYLDDLLIAIQSYHTDRMIQHHFHCREEKIISVAKRFIQLATYRRDTGKIDVMVDGIYLTFIDAIDNKDRGRELEKKFELKDKNGNYLMQLRLELCLVFAMMNSTFAQYFSQLTIFDIQFLLRLIVDCEYDQKESLEKITLINSSHNSNLRFPTAADDFSSFDPIHLCGTLSESVLSRKLLGYELGKKEIVEGQFAKVAPEALLNIVSEYYPVDVLNI